MNRLGFGPTTGLWGRQPASAFFLAKMLGTGNAVAEATAFHDREPVAQYDTVPRKTSVLPNVVGHCVITSGLGPVPARKASTAAQGVALRESVHTARVYGQSQPQIPPVSRWVV